MRDDTKRIEMWVGPVVMGLDVLEIGGLFKRLVVVIQFLHPTIQTCKSTYIVSNEKGTHE